MAQGRQGRRCRQNNGRPDKHSQSRRKPLTRHTTILMQADFVPESRWLTICLALLRHDTCPYAHSLVGITSPYFTLRLYVHPLRYQELCDVHVSHLTCVEKWRAVVLTPGQCELVLRQHSDQRSLHKAETLVMMLNAVLLAMATRMQRTHKSQLASVKIIKHCSHWVSKWFKASPRPQT